MKKALLIIVIIAAIGCGIFIVTGANVGLLVKRNIEKRGTDILGVPVIIDNMNISITSGIGRIENLIIENPKGNKYTHSFSIENLDLELNPLSIKKEQIHIKKMIIHSLEVVLEGTLTKNNLITLKKNRSKKPKSQRKIQLDYLKIKDIQLILNLKNAKERIIKLKSIEFRDLNRTPETTTADIVKRIMTNITKKAIKAAVKKINPFKKIKEKFSK
ncbi:hypothetical protein [Candidatus Uabimicrobium sp. HlEnr_7]|uniref:hypothetical protein n=1 Tax=Candidatus Uabimicrobium helgolandensis TaxID=3095367 RepID=UPI0035587EF3